MHLLTGIKVKGSLGISLATMLLLSVLVMLMLAIPVSVSADTGLEMPPGFVEVSPVDAFMPGISIPSDIATNTAGGWAYDDILYVLSIGAIQGYPDGTFRPKKAVTRAEFASVLDKVLFLPDSTDQVVIKDVSEDHWAYESIKRALPYLPKYGDGSFSPNAYLTREDIAVSLVMASGTDKESVDPEINSLIFSDYASISPSLNQLIAVAVDQKLIKGYKVLNDLNGQYNNDTPNDSSDDYDLHIKAQNFVTRAEMCHLINNARNIVPFGYKVLPDRDGGKNPESDS